MFFFICVYGQLSAIKNLLLYGAWRLIPAWLLTFRILHLYIIMHYAVVYILVFVYRFVALISLPIKKN